MGAVGICRVLRVATTAGTEVVDEFEEVGPFAVHRTLHSASWTVTHIATGRAIAWIADGCIADGRNAAIALAEKLRDLPNINWDFSNLSAIEEWPKSHRKLVRKTIKEATA